MSAPEPSTSDPSGDDADLAARFDVERARVLRRRIEWYCLVVLVLLIFSLIGSYFALAQSLDGGPPLTPAWSLELVYDLILTLIYAGMFFYAAGWKPDRRRLINGLTVMAVLAMVVAMPFEISSGRYDTDIWGVTITAENYELLLGTMSVGAYILLQLPLLLLIPMRPVESLRLVGPCLLAFAGVVALQLNPPVLVAAGLLLLFVIVSLPGMLWSRWRYREFDEHFRSSDLRGRFGELKSELAYARRIHEALFPPPIERGPVRLTYRYEPMRDIGGDFLFIHPLSFPPARPDGPLSVVLIDVSGHGVPAALAVNQLHGELRRFFSKSMLHGTHDSPPSAADGPAALLAHLNHYAYEFLSPQAVFATALAVRVDPLRGVVEWANAGHPPASIRRSDGPIEVLDSTAPMLGVLGPEDFDPAPRSAPFAARDRMIAFTDGAFEARDRRGEFLGLDRFRDLIAGDDARRKPAGDATVRLMEAVKAFRAGQVTDDILIVEITRAEADAPWPSQPVIRR